MEKFIPEVGPASEIEPKETKNPIVEIASTLVEASKLIDFDEEDEESGWIWFGVGGPA